MNFSEIAKDLAVKTQISRALGGVVKAGQYAPWAEEYKSIAQDHYDSLNTEKKADNPILSKALLGGGLGAGAGALGQWLTGDEDTGLGDILGAGALGALGGAGIGAGQALYSDTNALSKLKDALTGNAPPPGGYQIPGIKDIRDSINSKSVWNESIGDAATQAALVGGGFGGGRYLKNLEQGFKSRALAPDIKGRPFVPGVPDIKMPGRPPIRPQNFVGPMLPESVDYKKYWRFAGGPPTIEKKFTETPRPNIPGIKEKILSKGKKAIPAVASFTNTTPGWQKAIARRLPAKYSILGRLANALGIGSAGLHMTYNQKDNPEIGNILSTNIEKAMQSPEVRNNPKLLEELAGMKNEATSWRNYIPFMGIGTNRANQILDTLNQRFTD